MKRLTDLGLIRRVWGMYDGPSEYVYLPADSKARSGNAHTLDIVELYVRLVENQFAQVNELVFDPEPWCHIQVGHTTLKPDAYLDTGPMRYFAELDRGTEFSSQLSEKMRRYTRGYEAWDEPTFPLVVWVVHDADRKRFIERIIKQQVEPRLFVVVLFGDFVRLIHN